MPREYIPHRLAEMYHVSPVDVRAWPETDAWMALELAAFDAQEREDARRMAEMRR